MANRQIPFRDEVYAIRDYSTISARMAAQWERSLNVALGKMLATYFGVEDPSRIQEAQAIGGFAWLASYSNLIGFLEDAAEPLRDQVEDAFVDETRYRELVDAYFAAASAKMTDNVREFGDQLQSKPQQSGVCDPLVEMLPPAILIVKRDYLAWRLGEPEQQPSTPAPLRVTDY